MKENNVETGRSMLETLAVLAIIMVITIASIAGFDYLVQYRNRLETVKTVDLLVTSIKSGDLGRRRAQQSLNSIWDAGEIVKGPKLDDSGEALVLPDSEHSYAVVRTLKNGGWVMAMQINPKTCEEMVKSLAAQGATVYRMLDTQGDALGAVTKTEAQNNPGKLSLQSFKDLSARSVQRLADDKEADEQCRIEGYENPEDCRWGVNLKYMTEECAGEGEAAEKCQASKAKANARLNKIIQACKGGSGNAADSEEVVAGYLLGSIGCPGSVSADSNFVEYDSCGRCLYVQLKDACCHPDNVCGDVCDCKHPVGTVGYGQTCYCADCDTSQENDYDALYCKKTYGYYRQHVCIGENGSEHCGECSLDAHCQMANYTPADYKDAANYNKFKHDGQYYMYCVTGNKCRECNHDFDDNLTYKDDNTVYSDGHGNAYCPYSRPYCSEAGFCEGGCKDSQKGGNTDWGCADPDAPLCMPDKNELRNYNNGQGATGTECRLCFDSHPDEATRDDGCTASDRPLCAPGSDEGKYGSACYHCQRQAWANDTDRDLGCEGADGKNICPASRDGDQSLAGGYSNEVCVPCIDDQPGVGFEPKNKDDLPPDIAVDRGCGGKGSNKLLCEPRNMDGFNIQSPQNKIGQACRLCYNDKPDGLYDIGCTEFGKPNCKANQGEFGDECEASSGPVTPACMDDQTGSVRDSGCPMTSGANDQMLCMPTRDNTVNAGNGEAGTQCKKCFNNNADDKADDGCDEDAAGPLCVAQQSHYGDSCRLCQRGTGELFTSADLGCAGYSNKPVCNGSSAGDYGTACVRCKDDAVNGNVDMGCQIGSKTGGLCNAETHSIGTATGHFGSACMKCYNDKSDDGDDRVANRDVGCTDGDNLYCQANLHSYGDNCVSEPPPSKICKAYVKGESAPYTQMDRADCQRLFGHACTPTDCPTMVIYGADTHACLCSEPEPENPCPDGYYGKENGQVFKIGGTKAACEASGYAQQYEGLCDDTNCPAQTYRDLQDHDLQVCMCAVPPACAGGYYYKNQQENIAKVNDDDLRKYGLTPAVCPEQTITYQGDPVENACVCDLRCADGYYAYDGSEYNGPLSSTDPICRDHGGCTETNPDFEWKEISDDAKNACVIDVSCQGCLDEAGRCIDKGCLDEAGRCIDTEDWSDIKQGDGGKCACKEQDITISMDNIRWPNWAIANCTDGKGIRGNDAERVYYVDANGKEHAQYKKDGDISAKTVYSSKNAQFRFYCKHKARMRADVVDDYVVNGSFGVGNCSRTKVAGYGTACTNVQKDGFKSDYQYIDAGTELAGGDFQVTVADMYLCVTNIQNARVKIYAGTLPSPEKQAELAQRGVLRRDLNTD